MEGQNWDLFKHDERLLLAMWWNSWLQKGRKISWLA